MTPWGAVRWTLCVPASPLCLPCCSILPCEQRSCQRPPDHCWWKWSNQSMYHWESLYQVTGITL